MQGNMWINHAIRVWGGEYKEISAQIRGNTWINHAIRDGGGGDTRKYQLKYREICR
jgi:hypothetical protein